MLAFIEEGNRPVALLQSASGYMLHDPAQGTEMRVTPEVAATLKPFATYFYRSFGAALVHVTSMLKFGSHGVMRDFLTVILMGATVGLLGLVTPMATGMLFDTVIPGAERNNFV